MKKFITELDIISEIKNPVPLYCDNTEAVAEAKKSKSHHKSKHILGWFHLIQKIVERCDVIVERVDTKNNIADPLLRPYQCSSLTAILIAWVSSIGPIGFKCKWEIEKIIPYKSIAYKCDRIFIVIYLLDSYKLIFILIK